MKKFAIILTVFFAACVAFAYQEFEEPKPEKTAQSVPFCPTTKISDNDKCMDCHRLMTDANGKPYFGIKELNLNANYANKPHVLDMYRENGNIVAHMFVGGTNASSFESAAKYLPRHPEIKKLVVELHTGGGSIMDAWRAVGYIKEMQSRGILVEMRVYGLSASAGVFLLVAGNIGHRYVNPNCEIMMHKIWTFKMFSLETPDSAEDQAETLKHFQANINEFILSRSKMTEKELQDCIFKKDFWMTGKQAVKFGLADHLIGD